MSPFAPLFSFLMALFGVALVGASALTAAQTSTTTSSTILIADAPPVISAFVKSANELHPTIIYAGLHAYYSVQASDDNGLAYVTVNAPGMKYSGADNTICSNGAKTCSEPVYVIVPSTSGSYTVTVKATDTAGQTTTQILTFTAQGCVTDSECGGTYFPSSGATFCGPSDASRRDKRMKYGVVAVCSAGSCDEKTEPAVLEDCAAAGKMCGFSPLGGGQDQCVPIPSATCATDVSITSSCICGSQSYESYGRCCLGEAGNRYHTSSYLCPTVSSPPPSLFPNTTTTSTPSTTSPTSTSTWTYTAPTPAPVYAPTPTPVTTYAPITTLPITSAPTSTLAQPTPAQPTLAPVAQCLQAGGVWCYTESSQSNTGYCATAKSGCERKPETPQGDEQQFFAERRAILQDLRAIERLVKQDVVDVDAKLLKAYKEKLLALKPGEEKDLSVLQNYREKITELRGDEEPAVAAPSFVDPRAEAKAIKQMKRGLRPFERYLTTIETKVTQVEKAGIAVDASVKEAIATAKAVAKQVKDAKTYADVRDVADFMPDVGQALNDTLPRLEELLKLPRVFSVLDKKIVEAERAIAQTRIVAKKLKLDVTDNIAEMQALLAGAKEVIAAVKAGTAPADDLSSALEETVLDKVNGIFDLAAYIKTVGSIRQSVSRAAADAKRYESRIRRLEKAKENMQTASALLEQFNEYSADLKGLSKQKLTPEIGDQIIDSVRAMGDIQDELEDILRLSKPDPLETEIRALFSASGGKLKPFDVEKLEQEVL